MTVENNCDPLEPQVWGIAPFAASVTLTYDVGCPDYTYHRLSTLFIRYMQSTTPFTPTLLPSRAKQMLTRQNFKCKQSTGYRRYSSRLRSRSRSRSRTISGLLLRRLPGSRWSCSRRSPCRARSPRSALRCPSSRPLNPSSRLA